MSNRILAAAILSAAALFASPAQAANCACEHWGSPYDGRCEAYPQTGTETYEWTPWGAAYIPHPIKPSSPIGFYDIIHQGCRGGLLVTVIEANGNQSTTICRFGTGGQNC